MKRGIIGVCLIATSVLLVAYSIVNAIGAGFLTPWPSSFLLGLGLRWLVSAVLQTGHGPGSQLP